MNRFTCTACALLLATTAAVAAGPAAVETERRGPWAPRPLGAADGAPLAGTALQAQAEAKLRAAFDAAAAPHGGRLTREQAAGAGLGYVARHFDAIDRARAGSVRYADVQRHAHERVAAAKGGSATP